MKALWLVLLVAGDAPSARDVELALKVAGELERDRAFDAARRQLSAIAGLVAADDPELGHELLARVCNTFVLDDDTAGARRCWLERIQAVGEDPERRAEARYHAALVAPSPDMRLAELRAVVRQAPGAVAAQRALVNLIADARSAPDAAAREALVRGLLRDLVESSKVPLAEWPEPGKALLAQLYVLRARLESARGDQAAALQTYALAEIVAEETAWLDDVRLGKARALAYAGRVAEAIMAYEELRDSHKSSWFVGSYDGQAYDDAVCELAALLADVGRLADADEVLDDLRDHAPSSRCLDDAAFSLARARAERGDEAALERFAAEFPESRHVREIERP